MYGLLVTGGTPKPIVDKLRGVIVHFVPERADTLPQVVKSNDVILTIDGFALDIEGDYQDPEFGHLMLENLATRNKWAGDEDKMQVWREGRQLDITYTLPKFQYTNSLAPFAAFDQEPEYLIVGGLVFQPLNTPYLQAWGSDWKRRSPFRLYYFTHQMPTQERPLLVILSQVLPDPFNIGYQDVRYRRVASIGDDEQDIATYMGLLFDLGASVVTLYDLQGVADQKYTTKLLEDCLNMRKGKDIGKIGYHPHHVSGPKAISNSLVAYEIGIRRFDASLGGPGGCVTGAPGNQRTEELVRVFEKRGIKTGLKPEDVSALAEFVVKKLYR